MLDGTQLEQILAKSGYRLTKRDGDADLVIINTCAFNQQKEDEFLIAFTLVKIKRYLEICNKDRSQIKFLLGWMNRVMNDLEELG